LNEQDVRKVIQIMNQLVGCYRQLLEVVRLERDALANADRKSLQEQTLAKEGLIELARATEQNRYEACKLLLMSNRKKAALTDEPTLTQIIHQVQGTNLTLAEQLRSVQQTLQFLVKRVGEQNGYNQRLVQKSVEHVERMKRNILGEATPTANTYSQRGQRNSQSATPRFVSKEV
jgi:hypothetical protein